MTKCLSFNVCRISCTLSPSTRDPKRKAIQTIEISACQLLVAISSRLPQLRIGPQNKYRAGSHSTACGRREPIAFGEAETVGPPFHVHLEIYEARKHAIGWYMDSCKFSLWAEKGYHKRMVLHFVVLTVYSVVLGWICCTSSSLVWPCIRQQSPCVLFLSVSIKPLRKEQSIRKLTPGNFAGCSKKMANNCFFWRL